jgi:hypothetical protein
MAGCIQHRYLTNIALDGSVHHIYEAVGDSSDLYDGKISLPQGLWWEIQTSVVQDSAGNLVHTYRASMDLRSPKYLPSTYAPESTHSPDIFLRHPIYFKRLDGLLGVLFLYKQNFVNRQKEAKYGSTWDYVDSDCEVLLDKAKADSLPDDERNRLEHLYMDGLVEWTRAMILRRCAAVLQRDLEMHPDVSFSREQLQDALLAAKAHLIKWEPEFGGTELILGDGDLWNTVGKQTLQVISDELDFIGKTTFFADMQTVGDTNQWEFEITKDLEDDEFDVRLTLPGYVFYNNADEVAQDTLIWDFSGSDIFNDDKVITAYSIYVRWLPVGLLAIGIAAIIAILVIRKRQSMATIADKPID